MHHTRSRMQPGYVAMPCNNGLHSGKCPTVPTLRASSFITPYGNIPGKLTDPQPAA